MNKKKTIVWIDDYVAYPPISGYRVVIYESLKKFRQYFNIIYVSRAKREDEKNEAEKELAKYGIKSEIFVNPYNAKTKVIKFLSFLFSKSPLSVEIRYFNEIFKKLKKLFPEVDLFFFEGFYLSKYADRLEKIFPDTGKKILIRFHNNDFQRRKDIFKKYPTILNFIYLLKLKSYQNNILKKKWILATLSKDDFRNNNMLYLPPIVDVASNEDSINSIKDFEKNKNVIFVASFKNEANDDALFFLRNEIWPLIHKNFPEYRCLVYGKNSGYYKHLASPELNFFIMGDFSSPEKIYKNAFCVFIPLRIGSGIKLKVLEAVKYKTPIITTPIGIQGFNFEDKTDLLIANSPEGFCQKLSYLIINWEKRELLVENIFKKITKDFSIERQKKMLENL